MPSRTDFGSHAPTQRPPGRLRAVLFGALLGAVCLLPPGALADDAALDRDLTRLETGVRQLAERVEAMGGQPLQVAQSRDLPEGFAAQVQVRLGELEQQLRQLTGTVEQLQHNYNQAARRLDSALNDIEFRLAMLEGTDPGQAPTIFEPTSSPGAIVGATTSASPTPSSAQPVPQGTEGTMGTLIIRGDGSTTEQVAVQPLAPPPTPAGRDQPVSLPAGGPDDQYNHAYNILATGDYARAEQAMRAFVDANRNHPLASNAQYWLGETYYVRGLFNDAAIAFAEGYQLFRDGNKAVDSLLKLGMSLAAMGQRSDACLTLRELQSEFPNAPTAIVRRAQQEIDRLQCS